MLSLYEKLARVGIILALTIPIFGAKLHAQMTDIPRLQNIAIIEDGQPFPAVANQNGSVQITPGRLLKERNLQTLAQLLETYIGWPADASTVEAIGRALASWGKGNAAYFNLLAPISIPPDLTLTLYPKAEGPSFLTYVQPKINGDDSIGSAYPSSYWVDMAGSNSSGDYEDEDAENSKLRGTVSKLSKRLKKVEAEKSRLQLVLDDLSQDVRDAQVTTDRIRRTEEERVKLKGMINYLSRQLDDAEYNSDKARQLEEEERGSRSARRGGYDTSSSTLRSRTNTDSAYAQAWKDSVEREQMRTVVEKLSSRLKEVEETKAQIRRLESERDRYAQAGETKVQRLESEKEQLKAKMDMLTEKLRESNVSQAKIRQLENEQEKLRETLASAVQKLSVARGADARIKQVEAEKAQLQSAMSQLSKEMDSDKTTRERLQQVLAEKAKLQQTLEKVSRELGEEKTTRTRVTQLEADKKQLQSALKELSQELDDARGLQSRIQQVEVEKKKLHETLEGLSQEYADVKRTQSASIKNSKPQTYTPNRPSSSKQQIAKQDNVKVQTSVDEDSDIEDLPELKPIASAPAPRKPSVSSNVIQKVVIAMQGQKALAAGEEGEGIIVRIAQLPDDALEQIRQSAQILLNKPFTIDRMKQVGMEIGRSLKAYGLTHYDVVLPQQNIQDGIVGIEIRKIASKK